MALMKSFYNQSSLVNIFCYVNAIAQSKLYCHKNKTSRAENVYFTLKDVLIFPLFNFLGSGVLQTLAVLSCKSENIWVVRQ